MNYIVQNRSSRINRVVCGENLKIKGMLKDTYIHKYINERNMENVNIFWKCFLAKVKKKITVAEDLS